MRLGLAKGVPQAAGRTSSDPGPPDCCKGGHWAEGTGCAVGGPPLTSLPNPWFTTLAAAGSVVAAMALMEPAEPPQHWIRRGLPQWRPRRRLLTSAAAARALMEPAEPPQRRIRRGLPQWWLRRRLPTSAVARPMRELAEASQRWILRGRARWRSRRQLPSSMEARAGLGGGMGRQWERVGEGRGWGRERG